jgi:uncharacterized membrane protein HdeD (DUF308 family)
LAAPLIVLSTCQGNLTPVKALGQWVGLSSNRPAVVGEGEATRSASREEVLMSANWSVERERLQAAMTQAVREHWVLFLIEGIVLLVLGVLAVVIPPLATLAFTVFLGWLFVISGIFGLITTFGARQAPGFWWSLLSAVLSIVVGVVMVLWPVSGAVSLTLVLTAFFLLDGVASIMYSLAHRQQLIGQWGWLLASGLVDLAMAALIILGFPLSAALAVGLLVGINMIFSGTSLIVVALYARTGARTDAQRGATGPAYSSR